MIWQDGGGVGGGGAYLMKKEAAVDEEGEGEAEVTVAVAGSPGWLELPSRQGVRVLLLLLVVVVVMLVTGASDAVTTMTGSAVKPGAWWHTDTAIRTRPTLTGFITPAHLPSAPFTSPQPQMDGQMLRPAPVSGSQQYPQQKAPRRTARAAAPFIDSGNALQPDLVMAYCN